MINGNNIGATFRHVVATTLLGSAMLGVSGSSAGVAATGARDHWVATWTASPMPADASPDGINGGFLNQTLRETAHISIGGSRVRVRLSNAYGTGPLTVGAAHLALRDHAASIVALSDRALMFNGKGSVTIPAGALVLSDPIEMSVAALADLTISLYFPGATGPLTWHQLGTQTTYVASAGDATATESFPVASTTTSYYVLAGIEVDATEHAGAVVTLGDSITDGFGCAP